MKNLAGLALLCYNKLMVRKGDTLIEVTLAVGIFSMVAIAIVAVMSGGISSAQTALETTLTREEIDTQAEALRFIHSAYISDQEIKDSPYIKLWNAITSNAATVSDDSEEAKKLLQFTPSSCKELYDDLGNAFIINPKMLSSLTNDNIDSVYISAKSYTGSEDITSPFKETTTYPHLVYKSNTSSSSTTDTASLVAGNDYTFLYQANGIYVIAVKEKSNTAIVDDSGKTSKKAAFYDFYIRACWYGSNANEASTISTVIRLYDPAAITE